MWELGAGCEGVTGASVEGGADLGVCARGATSPLSGVTASLTGVRTGCGRGVGLSEDKGLSCRLAKGKGGLPDLFECPVMLCLVGKVGGHAPFT